MYYFLPTDVKAAAEVLGYTEAIWDADEEPPTSDYDYDELSAAQQSAIVVFGYNQATWDAEE